MYLGFITVGGVLIKRNKAPELIKWILRNVILS